MACEHQCEEHVNNLNKLFRLTNLISFEINEVKCTPGSSSGDNYMSVVKRIQISDGSLNSNDGEGQQKDAQQFSLIIKRQILSLSRRQLYRCDEAFCNEINAYKHVVPLLEQYSKGTLFPKCYFAGNDDHGEIIVLEDLKHLGYRMQNRLKGLELNYCQLVIKQLAQLHAASITAKEMDNHNFREKCKHLRDIVYSKEAEEFYKNILDTSIEESLQSLRTSNVDGCLTKPIRMIEELQSQMFDKIQNCITNPKESISVLCHGDLWVNNIMFAHNTDKSMNSEAANIQSDTLDNSNTQSPSSVRFFDLQAMRYTSPVFDILHFIYTSTKRDFREEYTRKLLETYCMALSKDLEKQFANTKCISSLDKIKDTFSLFNITKEYYEHIIYGLAIAMWILPAVTFDPNNIPNLDAISEISTSAKEIKCTQKLTPEYHSYMKDLALEFYHNGYLSSYLSEK